MTCVSDIREVEPDGERAFALIIMVCGVLLTMQHYTVYDMHITGVYSDM